jgi:lysophospholipase L1-like esterase
MTYLALGDSYTIGESVAENERWSYQLTYLLQAEKLNFFQPTLIAKTGWTTRELEKAIHQQKQDIKPPYDLVSLLIGVNNQYRGLSINRFRTQFRRLLLTAKEFAGGNSRRVLVLSIPDWGVTPFAEKRDKNKIASEIDSFNQVVKEECEKLQITFVDITPISRTAAGNPEMVAEDKLHFSGKMYRLWAEKALPEVMQIFGQ